MSDPIRTESLTKRYGATLAVDRLDRMLLGLHRPSAGTATIFGIDAWRNPVAAPSPRRLRRWGAVSLATAHRRGDAPVPRPDAWLGRHGLPAPARRAIRARAGQAGARALEGQPPESAAGRRTRHACRAAGAGRADERARPADGGRVPRVGAGGEAARPGGLPLLAHHERGRGALRPGRDPSPGQAGRRGDAGRPAAPEHAHRRGDLRRPAAGAPLAG